MPTHYLLTIDTNPTHEPVGSMARYAQHVQQWLDSEDFAYQVQSLGPSRGFYRFMKIMAAIMPRSLASMVDLLCRHLGVLFSALKLRATLRKGDRVHLLDGSYAYALNVLPRGELLSTVHDLIPWQVMTGRLHRASPSWISRQIIRANLAGLRRAKALFCISQATANLLPVADVHTPAKVVLLAIEENRISGIHPADSSLSVEHKTILHVGNNAFYKNRDAVITSFIQLNQRLLSAGPDISDVSNIRVALHIIGEPLNDKQQQMLTAAGLEPEQFRYTHQVTEAELWQEYQQADVFVFPSLFEGFGWPVLEAMAAGCPVVCSDQASLPEVGGSAAMYVSPDNHQQIAAEMLSVLQDKQLRQTMIAEGYQQAENLNMTSFRNQMTAAYRELGVL